jgi:hypothetical protein
MGARVTKIQTKLIQRGDSLVVSTRTTRYTLKSEGGVHFLLFTNNPSRSSGKVLLVGSMCTKTGQIFDEEIEAGRYMIFKPEGDEDGVIKTSLVLQIEFSRA